MTQHSSCKQTVPCVIWLASDALEHIMLGRVCLIKHLHDCLVLHCDCDEASSLPGICWFGLPACPEWGCAIHCPCLKAPHKHCTSV